MDAINAFLTVLSLIFYFIDLISGRDCELKNTCNACIETIGCSWCTKLKNNDGLGQGRCFLKEEINNVCDVLNIEDPLSEKILIMDSPLGPTVQIRPQRISLRLRTGDTATINIGFMKADDYPIDLYYLMDFSSSMSKYKRSLAELGDKLIETMKNVTTNFQLGFGSFVDKVALPFTDTIPSHLQTPCKNCRSPYSFKNHMPLSKATQFFSSKVRRAKMSGNNDTPEGSLDALLQAMVCSKQINWREKARHFLVLSTDAPFHLAGDGKLAGIVRPHDGECYVDDNGDYNQSLTFDYPSVSQIRHKAYENNVNIIFAVVHKVREEYNSLSRVIDGASVGFLDRGENIAQIIKSHYEKLSTTIRLVDDAKEPIHISYSANCPSHRGRADETWFDTNECTGVRSGEIIYFQARITSMDCSDKNFIKQSITIKPVGINELLTIDLETICRCDCDREFHSISGMNSEECSLHGKLVCGKCVCQSGRVGGRCECNEDDLRDVTSTKSCIYPNSTNQICSGHGDCVCGVCQCHKREDPSEKISGQYCECDNYSCDKKDGLICSGHGSCMCKKCSCHAGWSGESCDCPLDVELCTEGKHGEVCSGNGNCFCGKCSCHNSTVTNEELYTGKYCQICMTCGSQCELYSDCVECLTHNTGIFSEFECRNCTDKFHLFNFTDDAKGLHNELADNYLCISADQLGCSFKFIYYYDEDENLIVVSEREKICSKGSNVIAIICGTTGGTVLAGLLLLLAWKLLTTIHDKREYEKFERERALAKWGRGENPLYKTAIQSYRNPAYKSD